MRSLKSARLWVDLETAAPLAIEHPTFDQVHNAVMSAVWFNFGIRIYNQLWEEV